MNTLNFRIADLSSHRDEIVQLNIEYVTWVSNGIEASSGKSMMNITGMTVQDYVSHNIDKLFAEMTENPAGRGVFYLGESHGDIAAMIGLRWISDGVAEIKRLYVLPQYRGRHFGEVCLRKVLDDARDFGYHTALLDTAPFMYSAQRLYKRCGFVTRGPYDKVEIPPEMHANWVFMECHLLT